MSRLSYPVIFQKCDEGYLVMVPDIDRMTQGTDFMDAVRMAKDLISLQLLVLEENGEPYPVPNEVEYEVPMGATLGYVFVDMEEYRKKYGNKDVTDGAEK